MWQELFSALALVLVIEGLLPFLSPNGLRNAARRVQELNDQSLRFIGISSMLLGVVLLYLVR